MTLRTKVKLKTYYHMALNVSADICYEPPSIEPIRVFSNSN